MDPSHSHKQTSEYIYTDSTMTIKNAGYILTDTLQ